MSSSAFPVNSGSTLIADASVVIGLNASGYARRILALTSCRILVPENASQELTLGAKFGHDDGEQLDQLVGEGLIERVALGQAALGVYEALIDGTYGETLDDGEAATIAVAAERRAVALLDEKKARRMCAQHFPDILRGSTAEWLLDAKALGSADQTQAMLNALRKGRMRVPPGFMEEVVELIGLEAAADCPSLPRVIRQPAARTG
jgi:predicted nucleic acid-binding protein